MQNETFTVLRLPEGKTWQNLIFRLTNHVAGSRTLEIHHHRNAPAEFGNILIINGDVTRDEVSRRLGEDIDFKMKTFLADEPSELFKNPEILTFE